MGRRGIPTIDWPQFAARLEMSGDDLVDLALAGQWLDSPVRARALNFEPDARVMVRWVKSLDVVQRHHFENMSLTACGKAMGTTRQRATQLYDALASVQPIESVSPSKARQESAARKARSLARIFGESVAIIREHPGTALDDIAARVLSDPQELRNVLGELSAFVHDPVWSMRRGASRWSDEDIVACLRKYAAMVSSPVLTRAGYERLARHDQDAPSNYLIIKRFGTWSAALERAGLPYNAKPHDYPWRRERQEALSCMVTFVLETGQTSSRAYARWAAERDGVIRVPEAMVARDGSWTDAIQQVFALLRQMPARMRFQQMFDRMVEARACALTERYGVDFSVPRRPIVIKPTDPLADEPAPVVLDAL